MTDIATYSLTSLLKRLWRSIPPRLRRRVALSFIFMVLGGVSESLTLAALLPFLAVVANPSSAIPLPFLGSFFGIDTIIDPFRRSLLITIFFGVCVVLSTCLRLYNLWLNGRLSAIIGCELSVRSFKNTIFRPYKDIVDINSGDFIATTVNHLNYTMLTVNYALQILTALILSIAVITTLSIINLKVAIILTLSIGSSYILIAFFARKRFNSNSKELVKRTNRQVRILQEGFGAIREIKLEKNHQTYLDSFKNTDIRMRDLQIENQFLSMCPRILIEGFSLIIISTFSLVLLSVFTNPQKAFVLIGTFCVGAQRLLPALQHVYFYWAGIRSYKDSMAEVVNVVEKNYKNYDISKIVRHRFSNQIEFKNVSFGYGTDNENVLENINLTLNKGDCIGIIGKTGSGKSTFVDLILGLYTPTNGSIIVDNNELKENTHFLNCWQASITHVPQNIFLLDASIAANIIFAEKEVHYSQDRMIKAARIAQIEDYIQSQNGKYLASVGERGALLSGGQRQRIGLARAFYKNSDIYIFDESTSALDQDTEEKIICSLRELAQNKTILMISHRESTLKICNRIFEIKNKSVVEHTKNLSD